MGLGITMSLLLVLFSHFIGDWALQNEFMAKNKGWNFIVMLAHCVVYTGCVCIALDYVGMLRMSDIFIVFFTHLAMDTLKCCATNKLNVWLWVDQFYHLS